MSDLKSETLQESGLVDWQVFSELVAMDEDEEGFSKGLFQTFVDQFKDTFKEIDENVNTQNLDKLSSLGHYLKGLAAALGLTQIAEQCERIQNYGHRHNFDNVKLPKKKAEALEASSETSKDTAAALAAGESAAADGLSAGTSTEESDDADDESSDSFWVRLIEDAMEKAQAGFLQSKKALDEYFDDDL